MNLISDSDGDGGGGSLPPEMGVQFSLVLDAMIDFCLFVLNREGRVATWGRGAELILGYEEDEALGQPFEFIFTETDREAGKHRDELSGAARNGRATDVRWHRRHDGSEVWCEGALSALRDENGELCGYVKVLRDATRRKELEDKLQAAYEKDHRIADTLQKSLLLAPSIDSLRGLRVRAFYEPALDEALVGGDFYDAFPLEGGQSVLVVGDASGKGVDAAARTAEVKAAVRAFMIEYPYPARTLMRVNEFLCSMQRLREEVTTFVTLALAVVDPVSGTVLLASAGNEPPLILRANGVAEAISVGGMPLGVSPDAQYEVVTGRIALNDTLLLTTDGVTEARMGSDFLGYEGFTELAEQAGQESLENMGQAVLEGARTFGGGTFRDDVCLLLAQLK